jgi:exodeoxyribonuclease VII small subunit
MSFVFEKSMEKLKEIVGLMENDNTSLEKSLSLYGDGIKLYQQCAEFLQKATRKVEILKNGKDMVESQEKKAQVELFPGPD